MTANTPRNDFDETEVRAELTYLAPRFDYWLELAEEVAATHGVEIDEDEDDHWLHVAAIDAINSSR